MERKACGGHDRGMNRLASSTASWGFSELVIKDMSKILPALLGIIEAYRARYSKTLVWTYRHVFICKNVIIIALNKMMLWLSYRPSKHLMFRVFHLVLLGNQLKETFLLVHGGHIRLIVVPSRIDRVQVCIEVIL